MEEQLLSQISTLNSQLLNSQQQIKAKSEECINLDDQIINLRTQV